MLTELRTSTPAITINDKSQTAEKFRFTRFHSNMVILQSLIDSAEESHCSKDSLGKLLCFIENHKTFLPLNFCRLRYFQIYA